MKCSQCVFFAINRAKKDYGDHAMLPVMERMKAQLPSIPDAVVVWNEFNQLCLQHAVEAATWRWYEGDFSEITGAR